jgi:hypothetical protein
VQTVANDYQIDFLNFTVPTGGLPRVFKLLHAFELEGHDKGLYGYKFSFTGVGCRVLYSPDRPDVHVQLTGRGCDNFDVLSIPADCKVTRVDIAFDSFDGNYDVADVWGALQQGRTAGLARTITGYMGFAGKNQGGTIYIGSPKSDTRLRIYDKAAEQNIAPAMRHDYIDWTRYELQLRNDIANATYRRIRASMTLPDACFVTNLSNIFSSILRPMFFVCDDVQVSNSERTRHDQIRQPSSDWLSMFSNFNVDRPKPVHRAPTLTNLTRYVMGASSAFKALSLVFPAFSEMFHEKVSESQFSEKHQELLIDFAPVYLDNPGAEKAYYNLPF